MRFVDAHQDIKSYTKLKVELIKYHGSFAEDLGFEDEVVKLYNEEKALLAIKKPNVYGYILYDLNNVIGILELEPTLIETDNTSSVYIRGLYLKTEYRNKGYINEVMGWIKENYPSNYIECDCFYNLPSNDIVQHLGFKRLFTRYALKV